MYRRGMGTWFGAHLRFDLISRLNLTFNWTKEPDWEHAAPPREAYREELERFPREPPKNWDVQLWGRVCHVSGGKPGTTSPPKPLPTSTHGGLGCQAPGGGPLAPHNALPN
jgi:hypothetical protein